ncbi:MAG: RES family NAD+ phosphorylase [Gemmatimonadales bacterium]
MDCHRICRKAHRPLDGEGARLYGGRWNSPGRAVVYASATLALAALEYLTHLDSSDAPRDLVAVRITVPDDLPQSELQPRSLPPRWHRYPAPDRCRQLGDAWLAAGKTAILRVPAAPVPEEWNLLLNPGHPDFRRVKASGERQFHFDPRLIG